MKKRFWHAFLFAAALSAVLLLQSVRAHAGDAEPASRTRSSPTFSGRGIPARRVAPPSHIPDMLGRRALRSGRRAPENLSPSFGSETLVADDPPGATCYHFPLITVCCDGGGCYILR